MTTKKELTMNKVCPVCEKVIKNNDVYLTLNSKKNKKIKIDFCASDCLIYFSSRIWDMGKSIDIALAEKDKQIRQKVEELDKRLEEMIKSRIKIRESIRIPEVRNELSVEIKILNIERRLIEEQFGDVLK